MEGAGYSLRNISITNICPCRRTVVGLKVKDGVVLAVEKPIHSKLLKPYANRRIYTVDLPSGVVGTGLTADCRALANRARQECASHRETFENNMPGPMLAERLALFMQAYTLYGSVRPFCANLLVGSVDADGPHLYMIEPSGVCWVRLRSQSIQDTYQLGIPWMRRWKGKTDRQN